MSEPEDGMSRLLNVQQEYDGRLQRMADKSEAVLLAFIGAHLAADPSTRVSLVDEFSVNKALTRITNAYNAPKGKRKLYLLVNTMGGLQSSAFKIAVAIRKEFDDITVFVPHIASSGGTLIALTGNKVRMGRMSQLGPLDPQIYYKGMLVSAKSILAAKANLERRLEEKGHKMSRVDKHMLESIDPVVVEEHVRSLRTGRKYFDLILPMAGYKNEKIEELYNKLVFSFPSHGHVIQADTAKEIGVEVEYSWTDDEEWDMMQEWLSLYIDRAGMQNFIRYVVPNIKE